MNGIISRRMIRALVAVVVAGIMAMTVIACEPPQGAADGEAQKGDPNPAPAMDSMPDVDQTPEDVAEGNGKTFQEVGVNFDSDGEPVVGEDGKTSDDTSPVSPAPARFFCQPSVPEYDVDAASDERLTEVIEESKEALRDLGISLDSNGEPEVDENAKPEVDETDTSDGSIGHTLDTVKEFEEKIKEARENKARAEEKLEESKEKAENADKAEDREFYEEQAEGYEDLIRFYDVLLDSYSDSKEQAEHKAECQKADAEQHWDNMMGAVFELEERQELEEYWAKQDWSNWYEALSRWVEDPTSYPPPGPPPAPIGGETSESEQTDEESDGDSGVEEPAEDSSGQDAETDGGDAESQESIQEDLDAVEEYLGGSWSSGDDDNGSTQEQAPTAEESNESDCEDDDDSSVDDLSDRGNGNTGFCLPHPIVGRWVVGPSGTIEWEGDSALLIKEARKISQAGGYPWDPFDRPETLGLPTTSDVLRAEKIRLAGGLDEYLEMLEEMRSRQAAAAEADSKKDSNAVSTGHESNGGDGNTSDDKQSEGGSNQDQAGEDEKSDVPASNQSAQHPASVNLLIDDKLDNAITGVVSNRMPRNGFMEPMRIPRGSFLDPNGEAVSPGIVKGLLLTRNMSVLHLQNFAAQLHTLKDVPRDAKVQIGRELRQEARTVGDAYHNMIVRSHNASDINDKWYNQYRNMMNAARWLEENGNVEGAEEKRAAAARTNWGNYLASRAHFYSLLDENPLLGIHEDGKYLFQALSEMQFNHYSLSDALMGTNTHMSAIEAEQAYVDLLNEYIDAGIEHALSKADEYSALTHMDDLWKFGSPRFNKQHVAVATLGQQHGATLPSMLMSELQTNYSAYEAFEAYSEGVENTLVAITSVAVFPVPVVGPFISVLLPITDSSIDLSHAYSEEMAANSTAMITGYDAVMSAEDRTSQAIDKLVFDIVFGVGGEVGGRGFFDAMQSWFKATGAGKGAVRQAADAIDPGQFRALPDDFVEATLDQVGVGGFEQYRAALVELDELVFEAIADGASMEFIDDFLTRAGRTDALSAADRFRGEFAVWQANRDGLIILVEGRLPALNEMPEMFYFSRYAGGVVPENLREFEGLSILSDIKSKALLEAKGKPQTWTASQVAFVKNEVLPLSNSDLKKWMEFEHNIYDYEGLTQVFNDESLGAIRNAFENGGPSNVVPDPPLRVGTRQAGTGRDITPDDQAANSADTVIDAPAASNQQTVDGTTPERTGRGDTEVITPDETQGIKPHDTQVLTPDEMTNVPAIDPYLLRPASEGISVETPGASSYPDRYDFGPNQGGQLETPAGDTPIVSPQAENSTNLLPQSGTSPGHLTGPLSGISDVLNGYDLYNRESSQPSDQERALLGSSIVR